MKDFIDRNGAAILFIVCMAIFLIMSLNSCSPKIITQVEKEYVHDTTRVFKRDSVYFEKSDTIRQYFKGDTIYIDNIKWRIKYDIKEVHDTTKIVQIDLQEKEIPIKFIPKFYQICTWLWWLIVVAIILTIIIRIYFGKH